MTIMLEVINLKKEYPDFRVLVDFKLQKGEFLSLLGPSGCGKTTTLRLIAGLEASDEGQILLNGVDITKLSPQKRKFGLVFQDYALFPHLDVEENIIYGISRESKEVKRARLEEMLDLFHLSMLRKRSVRHLSGGEQQRVALARALAPKPEVLLLDEPFAALDPTLRLSLREELKQLQEKLGLTIIFVTHNQEEALSLSHRIILMEQGKIVQVDRPFLIYKKPQTEYVANFFGKVNLVELEVKDNKIVWGQSLFVSESPLSDGAYRYPIRPEELEIGSGVKGKIISNSYLGFGVEYVVATDYGRLRYLEVAPNFIREDGDEIELTLKTSELAPLGKI